MQVVVDMRMGIVVAEMHEVVHMVVAVYMAVSHFDNKVEEVVVDMVVEDNLVWHK